MLKLLKNFEKKDFFIVLAVFILVVFSVFLDLRIPEYMSEITQLVQTENSTMNEILIAGGHMVLCAVGSLLCTIVVGYLTSLLSARFSRNVEEKYFLKLKILVLLR